MFVAYVAYLVFQLFSHTHLYHDGHNKQSVRFSLKPGEKPSFLADSHRRISSLSSDSITLGSRLNDDFMSASPRTPRQSVTSFHRFSTEPGVASHGEHTSRLNTATTDTTLVDDNSDSYHTALENHVNNGHDGELKAEGKEPRISLFLTIVLLVVVTAVRVFPKFTT
jgi:Ca2+:H+ antiporter